MVLLLAVFTAMASHAASDSFSGRTPISGLGTFFGSNTGATAEVMEPAHAGLPATASVWWRWTATVSQSVDIDTFGSDFDTVLAVYTGTVLASLAEVASNDDRGGSLQSRVRFNAQSGVIYQLAVDGVLDEGSITLHIKASPPAPVNDSFAAGTSVTGFSTFVGSNIGATAETGEPAHADAVAAASVWWRWTPVVTGRVEVDTFGSGMDTRLAVYTGTNLGSLVEVAANDQTTGSQSRVRFQVQTGITYRIAVDGFGGDEGAIQLTTRAAPAAPPNDSFEHALVISGFSSPVTGRNVAASAQVGEPAHAGSRATASVWWRWTAPVTASIVVDTFGSGFDTVLAVYTGSTVNSLGVLAANDDTTGSQSRVRFEAVAGTTYRFAVDGYWGAEGAVRLHLSQPLILIAPPDVVLGCGADTSSTNTGVAMAIATNGCGPGIVTESDLVLPGGCPHELVIHRTWTASDGCGNSALHVQVITVDDATPPVLHVPAAITRQCQQSLDPVYTGEPTGWDDCGSVSFSWFDDVVASCTNPGVVTRTWMAQDGCGNATSAVQLITVKGIALFDVTGLQIDGSGIVITWEAETGETYEARGTVALQGWGLLTNVVATSTVGTMRLDPGTSTMFRIEQVIGP